MRRVLPLWRVGAVRPSLGPLLPSPQGALMPQRALRAVARPRPARLLSGAVAALVAGVVVVSGAGVASAAPENPTDEQLGDARATQDAAAAEVGRIAGLVADAEAQLEQVQVQAEAAGTAYLAAEEARLAAET